MEKKLPLIISIILNVLLVILVATYLFTPFLDYSILNKSMPRLCTYIEKNQTDLQQSFCE